VNDHRLRHRIHQLSYINLQYIIRLHRTPDSNYGNGSAAPSEMRSFVWLIFGPALVIHEG